MSRVLRLIVFDCDCTLWNFHVDSFFHQWPYKKVEGKVVDARGKIDRSIILLNQLNIKCLN